MYVQGFDSIINKNVLRNLKVDLNLNLKKKCTQILTLVKVHQSILFSISSLQEEYFTYNLSMRASMTNSWNLNIHIHVFYEDILQFNTRASC